MLELVKVYEEYIKLLEDELNETGFMAYIHGWRSSRGEKGRELREKIQELKNKIGK
jgi:hypothetical protein